MTTQQQQLSSILFVFNQSLKEIESDLQQGKITAELYEQQRAIIYSCTVLEIKLCTEADITNPCLN